MNVPQNKNLTQISFSREWYGKRNGVINAGKKGACPGKISKLYQKAGKKENKVMPGDLVKTADYNVPAGKLWVE